jgi:hypothetical protein
MVDFSKLLSKSADEISKPKPLPVGTYSGVVQKYEYLEAKNENKTPYVRLTLGVTSPSDDVDQDDLAHAGDISKKTLRKDYYLTEDSQYRIKELAEGCGIPTSGRSLGEFIPDLKNAQVLISVTHRSSQDGTEIYADVGNVVGV